MAYQAQDTFVITLPDGRIRRVMKGEVLADRDELVKHDLANDSLLFKPLDLGDGDAQAKRGPGRPRKVVS
jgi:hypothetical protein